MRLDPQKVQPGQALPEVSHTIDRIDLIRYAGASGDFNPIHWNDEVAKAVGLPGVIAHGMFSMGTATRVITAFAGDPGAIKRLRVRFSAMIQPGQTLTAKGEVTGVDGDRVTIRFWAEDEHGEKVVAKGEAELDLGPGGSGGAVPRPEAVRAMTMAAAGPPDESGDSGGAVPRPEGLQAGSTATAGPPDESGA